MNACINMTNSDKTASDKMMKIRCAFDEMVKITNLKSHPKNPNKHPEDQIKRLADILKYQGWRYPVKVSRLSGFVTSGHGRIEAARLNGWDEVPVNHQEYESIEQEYADVVSDNAIAAWSDLDLSDISLEIKEFEDFDVDLLGIKNFEINEQVEGQCDEDEIPEHVEPKTKLGDIYQLGRHRLMCGDSTSIDAVEKLMCGEKADMVFTDPPYGLSWSGGTWAEKEHIKDAERWDKKVNQSVIDSLPSLAKHVVLWGGNYYYVPPSRCWLSWIKSNAMKTMSDFELAWTNMDKCCKKFESAITVDGKRMHATQKPVALAEWCFDNFEDPKTVIDLFGGSGTTLIACEKTNRKCFMMELDSHYVDVIVARWCKYTGQSKIILNDQEIEWKQ